MPGSEAVTFWFHGDAPVDEPSRIPGDPYMGMDTVEPTGSEPSSKGVLNYVVGPNVSCQGNNLLPTWEGFVEGTVVGDVTLTIPTIAGASTMRIDVFADGTGACNSDLSGSTGYTPPFISETVPVPPGAGEVTLTVSDIEQPVDFSLLIMLSAGDEASQTRVLYDSADFPARIEFSCLPAEGEDSCNAE